MARKMAAAVAVLVIVGLGAPVWADQYRGVYVETRSLSGVRAKAPREVQLPWQRGGVVQAPRGGQRTGWAIHVGNQGWRTGGIGANGLGGVARASAGGLTVRGTFGRAPSAGRRFSYTVSLHSGVDTLMRAAVAGTAFGGFYGP